MEKPCKRVAIVGSGLAGLVSANLLFNDARQRYAVRVFESVWTPELSILLGLALTSPQGAALSLDAASVSVPNAANTSSDRVDMPMRAFSGGYYNNLKALYDCLGVRYHSQPFLFEFARSTSAPSQVHTCASESREPAYSQCHLRRGLEIVYR
jgi:uncharacterized protein with NAD-binding domain and iron-sulfur cluster